MIDLLRVMAAVQVITGTQLVGAGNELRPLATLAWSRYRSCAHWAEVENLLFKATPTPFCTSMLHC